MDPVTIFTVVGFVSALAFLPVLMLPEGARVPAARRTPVLAQARLAVASALRTPSVWLAGSLDAQFLVAKYAVKTFLPLQALSLGVSPAMVGVVLAAQEAASMALSPLGGRIGDRVGYMKSVPAGMLGMAAALVLMALAESGPAMLVPAVLMGVAQALVFPSTMALASTEADETSPRRGYGNDRHVQERREGNRARRRGRAGALRRLRGRAAGDGRLRTAGAGGDVDSVPRQDRRPVARPRPAGDARVIGRGRYSL